MAVLLCGFPARIIIWRIRIAGIVCRLSAANKGIWKSGRYVSEARERKVKLELRAIDGASGMNCERLMPMSALGALSFALWLAIPALGQSNAGELRLKVNDPSGLGVRSSVELASAANQYRHDFVTDDSGVLTVNHLPLGIYHISAEHPGFATFSCSVEIRSAIPRELASGLAV